MSAVLRAIRHAVIAILSPVYLIGRIACIAHVWFRGGYDHELHGDLND